MLRRRLEGKRIKVEQLTTVLDTYTITDENSRRVLTVEKTIQELSLRKLFNVLL